jgi:hypothetical protein
MARQQRGRAFLVRQVEQAAQLGHRVDVENRDRRDEFPEKGHAAVKWWAVCSCGYRSTVRATQAQALATAFWHCGEVVGDASRAAKQARRDGVSLPGSVTPGL